MYVAEATPRLIPVGALYHVCNGMDGLGFVERDILADVYPASEVFGEESPFVVMTRCSTD